MSTYTLQAFHVMEGSVWHVVALLDLARLHHSVGQDDLGHLDDEAHGQQGVGVGVVGLLALRQTWV